MQQIAGNIVDIAAREIYFGTITINNGRITEIIRQDSAPDFPAPFITPGFVDAHVHIESSLLVPSEFARMAVVQGTVATISDPHEIANVCGMEGVEFMIRNGNTVPFKFHFGAPSCVPATTFETAGAKLDVDDVKTLLARSDIYYLSEMMNFPGVLHKDPEVMAKIQAAKDAGKPVDGHAPGLRGEDAARYIAAGITTDHECFTEEEAREKLQYGMKILVREGSAAKNFEALAPLLEEHYENMMFCSDDKHPDSLLEGHINQLCARAVAKEVDLFKVLQVACVNPVKHYNMNVGLLRVGDPADLVVLKDLTQFEVLETYIDGIRVAENGNTLIPRNDVEPINRFNCAPVNARDLEIHANGKAQTQVIGALNGQLITEKLMYTSTTRNELVVSNVLDDVLKIVVVNRYHAAPVAKAFIKNFRLTSGAIASSVAHDSHNIVAVGVDDESLARAINLVISTGGGLAATGKGTDLLLPLPVGGLMSADDAYEVAESYTRLDRFVKEELGSLLHAPFMTLSFMALLVIPHLKLSDKGLFDGDTFSFVD